MLSVSWLLIALPLASFFVLMLAGRRADAWGHWAGVAVSGATAVVAIGAFFEMIEWWAAVIMGGAADAYLATQGDIWDTQWDMFLAMCGAILSLLLLSRQHDRELGLSR